MPTVNGPDEITTLEGGNDKVFYSNNYGAITELALGAADTVLTSAGATSAPTFSAIPASGGTKEMVASGAISGAGISVALNSDGTVSAVADNRVSAAFGRYAAATSTSISITMTRVYGIYHAEEDKVVIFYPSNEWDSGGGGYKLYTAAASISGSTLTFGTSIQIAADYMSWMGPYNMGMAYDPDTYKVWYMWGADTFGGAAPGPTLATATVSGTTVTKTAEQVSGLYAIALGTQDNATLTYDTTNNQMVACYSMFSGPTCSWFVVSESGGTITIGSALVSTTANAAVGVGNMVWLPSVARLVCWSGTGTTRAVTTIAVSGTTLSLDQQDIFTGDFGGDGQYGHENFLATTSNGAKVFAGGRDMTTSKTTAWNIYTITAGSATTGAYSSGQDMGYPATQWQGCSITRMGTTDTYVIQNQGDHINYFGTIELGALGTATPTLTIIGTGMLEDNEGTNLLDGGVGTNCNDGWMGSSHNAALTTSQWTNPTYKQAAAAMLTPVLGATTAISWFGISEAAISDTATGTITITGGTNTGVSGLTTGETYFMQADGSLATTKDSPVDYGKVGPALSATSILIQGIGDTTLSSG